MVRLIWLCRFLYAWGIFASVSFMVCGRIEAADSVSIRSDPILLLEFMSTDCPACQAISPLLEEFKQKKYPIQKINFAEPGTKPLFDRYSIKSMPTFVMLLNGQEVDRFVSQKEPAAILKPQILRMFNQTLAKRDKSLNLSKNDVKSSSLFSQSQSRKNELSTSSFIRGQMSETSSLWDSQSQSLNNQSDKQNANQNSNNNQNSIAKVDFSERSVNYSQSANHRTFSPITSSVRIRVNSSKTSEKGTGTIIHSTQTGKGREGLVLTCGHLFRETQGQGKIEVDVFDPISQQATTVEGVCVFFDDEIDIGFIGIPLPFDVEPMPLVPIEYWTKVGDRALSVGCSNGEEPSIWEHQILSTTQSFFQPQDPKSGKKSFNYIQVSNAPVQGRSGGGLFLSSDSGCYLLGVCNAGDPSDNNGYFLPTSVIYETLLATPHLKKVYNDLVRQSNQNDLNIVQTKNGQQDFPLESNHLINNGSTHSIMNPNNNSANNLSTVAVDFNQELPISASLTNDSIRPVNYEGVSSLQRQNSPASSDISQENLNKESLLDAGLQELRKRQLEGAEIICVVNWPSVNGSNQNNGSNPTKLRETEVIRLPKR
ncbi:MAG: trypsin-like peptidase domain-containing protein [Planctomycetia bacterium]|nr:trypsin-like peptidase domain-containing protein [Planctomycetia bacterium]